MTASITTDVAHELLQELAGQFAQPPGPLRDLVVQVVGELTDPVVAWRRLRKAGLLPPGLVDGDRRFGIIDTGQRRIAVKEGDHARSSTPPTIDSVVTLASDPDGVLRAEEALADLNRRLVPWGLPPRLPVEWYTARGRVPRAYHVAYALDMACGSLEYALEEEGLDVEALFPDTSGLPHMVVRTAQAHLALPMAIEMRLEVPGAHWPPQAVKWKPFAQLEDPFAPALDLWRTGYLGWFATGEDGTPIAAQLIAAESQDGEA